MYFNFLIIKKVGLNEKNDILTIFLIIILYSSTWLFGNIIYNKFIVKENNNYGIVEDNNQINGKIEDLSLDNEIVKDLSNK